MLGVNLDGKDSSLTLHIDLDEDSTQNVHFVWTRQILVWLRDRASQRAVVYAAASSSVKSSSSMNI